MSFKDFVKAIADIEIKHPQLKAAMLAQSIMECGREDTPLSKIYNNHHGMKYRPEMDGFATSVYYPTDTEPTGGANFCKFADKKAAVVGYWHFLTRSPYVGWENYSDTAEDFLKFIGFIWCPPGYTDAWKREHGGLVYHEYIMEKLYPEAVKLLKEVNAPIVPTTEIKIFNCLDDVGLVAYTDKKASDWIRAKDTKAITSFLLKYPSATSVLFALKNDVYPNTQKPTPTPTPQPTPTPTPKTKIKGKGVLLNNGHPQHGAGATSQNGKVDEYELNLFQCKRIKGKLDAVGIPCKIINQTEFNGSLSTTGLQAEGYDAFIITHHNATKGAQYVVILLGNNPKAGSKEFGKILSSRIAKVLGIPDNGINGDYVVSVTKAGDSTNCPIVCLTESYFIDSFTDMDTAYAWSAKAADEIANALIERFT